MNLRPPLFLLAILTAAVGLMVSPNQARASFTLSFEQVGPDVVATYSGSWDSWTETSVQGLSNRRVSISDFQALGERVEGYRWEANPPKKSGAVRTDITTDADLFSGDAFGFSARYR